MADVRVPKMGMQTVEVDIDAVHVAVGDVVEADTVVVDVASEKSTFAVEAGVAGTIEDVLVKQGDEVAVGDIVVRITPRADPSSSGHK
jgi:2-oxoglutarate dehydrogenase E2 component (dihydrolipoamide succinyltransferase)